MNRWIDVDALYDFMNRANIPYNALIQEAIDFQPSISIVRCKDCKWYEKACTFFAADPFEYAPMEKNDFCSYGERSEE